MAASTLGKLWEREVLSRLLEHGMRGVDPIRHEVLRDVRGRVLEIGFGTGVSLPHYGSEVRELIAVEPATELAAIGRARLERFGAERAVRTSLVEASASRALPIDAASVDAVVILFVLCSVKHLSPLLDEMHRVLVPGGAIHLAEHVAADDDPTPHRARARTQRLVRPAWKLALGGCDPHRSLEGPLTQAGFDTEGLARRELDLPWIVRSGLVGHALRR